MAVNDMTFNQAATVLNSIVAQATGKATITPTNTSEFVSVAQTALKTGYDPVMNAINQVISKTIFSTRPYSQKFKGLEVSAQRYGNHVRKLSLADTEMEDDDRYKWPAGYDSTQTTNPTGDGQSVDQYKIHKPSVLQTNFYGENVWQNSYTIFRDQLDCAFSGPEEFSQFIALVTSNRNDKLTQAKEDFARATLANLIGGILDEGQTGRVVHLLSDYKTLTGLTSLTAQDVYKPANFGPFMKYVYSKVASISAMMTERSQMYQTVVNAKPVYRHTPMERQRVYLYAPTQYQTEAMVLADTYHDTFLRYADHETVNFWQSIESPDSISVTPSYTGTTGAVVTGSGVEQGGIFGVLMDEEAAGYAVVNQWSSPSPFNARGGYTNFFDHVTMRNWNDSTEKAVVLVLD